MAKYRLYIGKSALGKTFSSKAAGLKYINMRIGRYKIGGRGFNNKLQAIRWRNNRIKNPPLGQTGSDVRRWAIITKIKDAPYRLKVEN